MDPDVDAVSHWMVAFGAPRPFRVNVRYHPSGATVRVVGNLGDGADELVRVLSMLARLPAPVRLDITGASAAAIDAVVDRCPSFRGGRPRIERHASPAAPVVPAA